jgi:hypothetical protein
MCRRFSLLNFQVCNYVIREHCADLLSLTPPDSKVSRRLSLAGWIGKRRPPPLLPETTPSHYFMLTNSFWHFLAMLKTLNPGSGKITPRPLVCFAVTYEP